MHGTGPQPVGNGIFATWLFNQCEQINTSLLSSFKKTEQHKSCWKEKKNIFGAQICSSFFVRTVGFHLKSIPCFFYCFLIPICVNSMNFLSILKTVQ
jgi:hypothetical protein